MTAPATLDVVRAVRLQTDDKTEARLLAEGLRAACERGEVECLAGERMARPAGRRIVGHIGAAAAGARFVPAPPAVAVPTHLVSAGAFVGWLRSRGIEPSDRVRAWLAACGGAVAPAADEPAPRRVNVLSGVIKRAEALAGDGSTWSDVWNALVQLAQSPSRPRPLLGYVEGEGIKYEGPQGVEFLSREAFSKRHKRAARLR